jgi:hypothetical protein
MRSASGSEHHHIVIGRQRAGLGAHADGRLRVRLMRALPNISVRIGALSEPWRPC